MCFDDIEESLAHLRAGVIDVLMVQSPRKMGYLGVQVLNQYLEQGSVAQEFYDVGVTPVTLENVDTYKSTL